MSKVNMGAGEIRVEKTAPPGDIGLIISRKKRFGGGVESVFVPIASVQAVTTLMRIVAGLDDMHAQATAAAFATEEKQGAEAAAKAQAAGDKPIDLGGLQRTCEDTISLIASGVTPASHPVAYAGRFERLRALLPE